jgi:hypothetical protein
MNSNELKELVKLHFSLVDSTTEVFGEIMDENKAFTLLFEGDTLEVGKEVKVRTADGQELTAPDGFHTLENGMVIKVESGVVTEIKTSAEVEAAEGEELKEMTPVEGVINDKVGFEEVVVEAPAEIAPIVEEVAKAVIEAVKDEITAIKEELAYMKKKMAELEDAPAIEKAMPEKMSTDKTIKTEADAFNKDRFAAVMERFSNKK